MNIKNTNNNDNRNINKRGEMVSFSLPLKANKNTKRFAESQLLNAMEKATIEATIKGFKVLTFKNLGNKTGDLLAMRLLF